MENEFQVVKFIDNNFELDVRADKDNDTVWLNQDQISELFQKSKSKINEHINNIYNEGELNRNETIKKFGNSEFSTKPTFYYSLDVIISVVN